jgi:hypothetical protein
MTSYYTELDDDLGAEEEAERDMIQMRRRHRMERSVFNSAVAREVQKQLKALGVAQAVKPTPQQSGVRGKMVGVKCRCGKTFQARVADRKRGWGKYCSKRCKALYSK